MTLIDF